MKKKKISEFQKFVRKKYGANYRTNGDGLSAIMKEFTVYKRKKKKVK